MARFDRRTFLKTSGAAGVVGVTGLSGCLSSLGGGGGEIPTVNVGYVVPVEFPSPMAVPEVQDKLDNAGSEYELSVSQRNGTPATLNAIAAGEIDMGNAAFSSFPAAINGNAVESGLMTVAMSFYDAHPDWFAIPVYAMKESGIEATKDLEGKKIAVNALGTGVHAIVYKQLRDKGIDPENGVEFVEVPFPAMGSAMREGKVDAGIFPASFAAQERAKGGITTVFDSLDAFGEPYPFAFMTASNSALDEKPDAMRAWTEDYVQMTKYLYNNREEAIPPIAEYFDIPAKGLEAYFLTHKDMYRPLDGHMDIAALQNVVDILKDLGFIDAAPSMSDHVTNKYLPGYD